MKKVIMLGLVAVLILSIGANIYFYQTFQQDKKQEINLAKRLFSDGLLQIDEALFVELKQMNDASSQQLSDQAFIVGALGEAVEHLHIAESFIRSSHNLEENYYVNVFPINNFLRSIKNSNSLPTDEEIEFLRKIYHIYQLECRPLVQDTINNDSNLDDLQDCFLKINNLIKKQEHHQN